MLDMSAKDAWEYEQMVKEKFAEAADRERNRWPERAVDADQQKITDLEREVLQMRVHIQAQQLEELTEKVQRDQNPAVKDAWEQYQTVLRLAKE